MTYIISSSFDQSTSEVIEWLNSLKKEYTRINDLLDNHKAIEVHINNVDKVLDSYSEKIEKLIDLNSVWFRKGEYYMDADRNIAEYYKNENSRLIDFLFTKHKRIRIIGKPFYTVNKLEILSKATEYGLTIPDTLLTNSKIKLKKFAKKNKKIISKPISELLILSNNQEGTYATLIGAKTLDSLPEKFYTSLFQQYIDKEFDIRIFYLDRKLYSMAIFSQNDDKTKIDFRNYNYSKPNRTVPYKLPMEIEEKLIRFMNDEKMEIASIDMVKCKKTGSYYFLEVNPWGQFGMVCTPVTTTWKRRLQKYYKDAKKEKKPNFKIYAFKG